MLYDIEKYKPSQGERFLFDTNVWLYIYSPSVQYDWHITEVFGRFMHKCSECDSRICMTAMILSEFYNTAMRIGYKNQHCDMYKKDFRNKQTLGQDIYEIIKQCIIPKVEELDDEFSSINFDGFCGEYDFNDYYIIQLCKKYDIKIVTNDSDFKQFANEVDIITLDSNYVESKGTVKMNLLG